MSKKKLPLKRFKIQYTLTVNGEEVFEATSIKKAEMAFMGVFIGEDDTSVEIDSIKEIEDIYAFPIQSK